MIGRGIDPKYFRRILKLLAEKRSDIRYRGREVAKFQTFTENV